MRTNIKSPINGTVTYEQGFSICGPNIIIENSTHMHVISLQRDVIDIEESFVMCCICGIPWLCFLCAQKACCFRCTGKITTRDIETFSCYSDIAAPVITADKIVVSMASTVYDSIVFNIDLPPATQSML